MPIETNPTTQTDLSDALRSLGLDGKPLCVHSSLRSFGRPTLRAEAVIDAALSVGCTLMVPAFGYIFARNSLPGMKPARNGWAYDTDWDRQIVPGDTMVYRPSSDVVAPEMGALPAALLHHPKRIRGEHPVNSFAAVGPLAEQMIGGQKPMDVYAPLRELIACDGWIVLMGVGLNSLTLLHYAESLAGRTLFRRWANGSDGRGIEVECGGCSSGFGKLLPAMAPAIRRKHVGQSEWMVMPAGRAAELAAQAIATDPQITHCGRPDCDRCRDGIAGGPIV